MRQSWNHNIEYHRLVIELIPASCEMALDVGCGEGGLTRRLAPYAQRVIGLDVDTEIIATAEKEIRSPNVAFAAGDVMTIDFQPAMFTFVCSVATLHHLPLELAIGRFAELLAPGGTLVVVGLYRSEGAMDLAYDSLSYLASHVKRRFLHFEAMNAPTHEPQQTLREIRETALRLLPGSTVKRRLFFRYSLVWCKPCAA